MNYLEAWDAIITRIIAAVPGLQEVRAITDATHVSSAQAKTPSAYVLYDGESVLDADRGDATVQQRYVVILSTRNAGGATAGIEDAGVLLHAIHAALAGYEPGTFHTELERAGSTSAEYAPGGVAHYPLAFVTNLVIPPGGYTS